MEAKAMSVPTRRLAWLGLVGPVALAWLGGCSADTATGPGGPNNGMAGSNGTGGTGDVYAFDARTGKQVWRYAGNFGPPDGIRTGIMATPMSYRVNGKQYVSVVARSRLLTFALP